MTFVRKIALVFLFFSFSFYSSRFTYGIQEYSRSEALKVIRAIEKVKSEQSNRNKNTLENIVITESELNSYIAYRIETEKEEIMRELRLKLFDGNKIEGKILIDLRGHKIPKFLRPCMNLYFEAKIQVKNGNIRFDIKKLFLEGQSIQSAILDVVSTIASKLENSEPSSIKDWHKLPYGIKDIKTHLGKAVFYY